MGQKVNPIGLRVGVNRTWDSRWYADGAEYVKLLHEDFAIREFLEKRLSQAGISKIVIERPAKRARVTIHSARPGVIIGKKGADIEKLRGELAKLTGGEVALNIHEIRKPEMDAQLVADNVAQQLERRGSFRRAMKRAVQNTMRLGALGIRINCAGRLGGGDRTDRMVPRRPCAAAHPTCGHRLRHRRSPDHLRHHWREGLDLQGRHPRARSDGQRTPRHRWGSGTEHSSRRR